MRDLVPHQNFSSLSPTVRQLSTSYGKPKKISRGSHLSILHCALILPQLKLYCFLSFITIIQQSILNVASVPSAPRIRAYVMLLLKGKKDKAGPLQTWSGPEGSRKLRFPDFKTTAKNGGKVVSLTHRPPLPSRNTPGTYFCQRLSRTQGHSATGKIMSLKNTYDTIENRTRDLPVCSLVP